MIDYVHNIPGRLRIKSAVIKKNPAEAAKIKSQLSSIPGVQNLDVNLVTGSILIRYDAQKISSDQLLQTLNQAGYFQSSKVVTHDDVLHSVLTKGGKAIGSLVVGALEFDSPALAVIAALI
ncbi:MAG TPA: cation transporter [Methylomirabilota bacterium]|jgi:copper chaperone CopZ|nr:cation transporter [Methylomirabilota bacterium]